MAIAILEGRVTGATLTMAEHNLNENQQTAIAVRMRGGPTQRVFPEQFLVGNPRAAFVFSADC